MKKDFFKKLYPLTKLYLALALIISAFIIPSHIYDYSMIIICGIIVSFENKLAVHLFFNDDKANASNVSNRYYGFSIRPVQQ